MKVGAIFCIIMGWTLTYAAISRIKGLHNNTVLALLGFGVSGQLGDLVNTAIDAATAAAQAGLAAGGAAPSSATTGNTSPAPSSGSDSHTATNPPLTA